MTKIALVLLLASPGAASPVESLSEELRSQLALRRDSSGWEYRGPGADGKPGSRRLLEPELRTLEPFLKAAAGPAGSDAIALPLRRALQAAGLDPALDPHPWFEAGTAGARPSDAGRAAAIGVILAGAPAEIARAAALHRAPPKVALPDLSPRFDGEGPRAGSPSARLNAHAPLPVNQGRTGRGYALHGSDSRVLGDGERELGVHLHAQNFIHREQREGGNAYWKRFETESAVIEYRRGLRFAGRPAELGLQVSGHTDTDGALNGVIEVGERAMKAMNRQRFGSDPVPRGAMVMRNGRVVRSYDGSGPGFGDVLITVKTALQEVDPAGRVAGVAARAVVNAAVGDPAFTRGSYMGAGVTTTVPLTPRARAHADMRVTAPLDSHDALGLPLARTAAGMTVALSYELRKGEALVAQIDVDQSPYKKTGLLAYDGPHGKATLGWNKVIARGGGRRAMIQAYVSENFSPKPFRLIHNSDADLTVGGRLVLEQ